jgi:hypothetical protein
MPDPQFSQFYPLEISEGNARWRPRRIGEGIAVSASGLSWLQEGGKCEATFEQIARINLRTTPTLADGAKPCVCRIVFRARAPIQVSSFTSWGLDLAGARSEAYQRFVLDLHARLNAAQRTRIAFVEGAENWKDLATRFAGMAAVLLAVAPVAWVIFTGQSPWLFTAVVAGVAALAFGWALWSQKPCPYSPSAIPERLFP